MNEPEWEFHPEVRGWFDATYDGATDCQRSAWPAIQKQSDVLVAAPTGSGKTLAAFLAVIDELVRMGVEMQGTLPAQTHVVYVSPLKALSYDIEKNLEAPLDGIRKRLVASGYPDVHIRSAVRTGDTSQSERQKMVRNPPHILVTTPESLYLLLTSESGRRMLGSVRRLIIDEIHSMVGNKRGAHLALSIARLQALLNAEPVKIGLSATQKPVDRIASFLTARTPHACAIVDSGHIRQWDLAIEVPSQPLESVMSTESWQEVYQKIADLTQNHRTTLLFVNTRRHVERASRYLADLVGKDRVGSHHGSLSKEHRHEAEQRLKAGSLKVLVATASLELGIDIGDVDLVCQIASPRSIAVFLQRVGRSGHSIGRIPKGRIFPTSRDELVESVALLKAVSDGELEQLKIQESSLDALAQQIVAEVSMREWNIDDLYQCFTSAYPYRNLEVGRFHEILQMLAEGFSLRRGRRGAYIHLDAVNRMVRTRKGARLAAVTNAGVIPDQFDYDVILEPEDIRIGTVNEDFAFESLVGDIFQLGNISYRIRRVEKGVVRVEDANGMPPNIPFWLGDGRGRSNELSSAVSDLREFVSDQLDRHEPEAITEIVRDKYAIEPFISHQVVNYLTASKRALGVMPTQDTIVLERFLDEMNDAHLVVHSVYGSRLNRAWGLALRKRFCVRFNFELQAAALEDSFVLSLGPTHSFALDGVRDYVKSANARRTVSQAVLGAPMFGVRWRWAASTALAILRFRNGKKVPPPFQRNDSEDLLSVVFPDQLACQENITGPVEIPEHPLVDQTLDDCMNELMDVEGFIQILEKIENNEISIVCRDLSEPSPLAQEVLTAKPYAFLDDAPAEERRTLAVQSRRYLNASDVSEYGAFDADVIEQLHRQAWPNPSNSEELHDALMNLGVLRLDEIDSKSSLFGFGSQGDVWQQCFESLAASGRATRLTNANHVEFMVAAERLDEVMAVHPDSVLAPQIAPASLTAKHTPDAEQALVALIRGRMEIIGPCSARQIAETFDLAQDVIDVALAQLESEGTLIQGRFGGNDGEVEWCERRFLSRIHKATILGLRKEIKPVDAEDHMRYLMQWSRLSQDAVGEGPDALGHVLSQLEGYEAAAGVWESELLPPRIYGYTPELLDFLSASGSVLWTRLSIPETGSARNGNKKQTVRYGGSLKSIPLAFVQRNRLAVWLKLRSDAGRDRFQLSGVAQSVAEALKDLGPLFYSEILEEINQLPGHLEEGLVELFALGIATCDHFGGIRALLTPQEERRRSLSRFRRSYGTGVQVSGRWSLLDRSAGRSADVPTVEDAVEYAATVLLRRYGIVFKSILSKEGRFMPGWGELRSIYRRMEDRGDVRGGRFITGISGEQFALPEAIELLRETRRRNPDHKAITVHSSDPLNLSKVLTPQPRIAAHAGNYLVYRDGHLISVVGKGVATAVTSDP